MRRADARVQLDAALVWQQTCCLDFAAANAVSGQSLGALVSAWYITRPTAAATGVVGLDAAISWGQAYPSNAVSSIHNDVWTYGRGTLLVGERFRAGPFYFQVHVGAGLEVDGAGTEIERWSSFVGRAGVRLGLGSRRHGRMGFFTGYDYGITHRGVSEHYVVNGVSVGF